MSLIAMDKLMPHWRYYTTTNAYANPSTNYKNRIGKLKTRLISFIYSVRLFYHKLHLLQADKKETNTEINIFNCFLLVRPQRRQHLPYIDLT